MESEPRVVGGDSQRHPTGAATDEPASATILAAGVEPTAHVLVAARKGVEEEPLPEGCTVKAAVEGGRAEDTA